MKYHIWYVVARRIEASQDKRCFKMSKAAQITFKDFRVRFATEDACRDYLFQERFPDGFVCPKCGGRHLSGLKDFTSLRYLDLYAASYNASYDEETDPLTGLEFLSSLTNLTSLELRGLGDVSPLELVKKLKNLTYLYFSMNDRDTEVPEDLLVELQKSLPKCSISHY